MNDARDPNLERKFEAAIDLARQDMCDRAAHEIGRITAGLSETDEAALYGSLLMAAVYFAAKRYEDAIPRYRHVINASRKHDDVGWRYEVTARMCLGVSLLENGRFDEGLDELQSLAHEYANKKPNCRSLYYGINGIQQALWKQGRQDEIVRRLRPILEMMSDTETDSVVLLRYTIGGYYQRTGRPLAAKDTITPLLLSKSPAVAKRANKGCEMLLASARRQTSVDVAVGYLRSWRLQQWDAMWAVLSSAARKVWGRENAKAAKLAFVERQRKVAEQGGALVDYFGIAGQESEDRAEVTAVLKTEEQAPQDSITGRVRIRLVRENDIWRLEGMDRWPTKPPLNGADGQAPSVSPVIARPD